MILRITESGLGDARLWFDCEFYFLEWGKRKENSSYTHREGVAAIHSTLSPGFTPTTIWVQED